MFAVCHEHKLSAQNLLEVSARRACPTPNLGSRVSMGGDRGHHEVVAASGREAGCSTQSWGVGVPCARLIKR